MSESVECYLGVGSNIEPEWYIPSALRTLQKHVRVIGSSTFYRTKAIGLPGQNDFLNGVWRIETNLAPRVLKFDVLRAIEVEHGRVRGPARCAARTIDLDLLLYGDQLIDDPDLRIPHPDITRRAFVAVPLLELAPNLELPGGGTSLLSLNMASQSIGLVTDATMTRTLRTLVDEARGFRERHRQDAGER